ncbi:MAG: hypothetical protein QXO32_07515 [Candidatus Bathyarchaeia archaeon]
MGKVPKARKGLKAKRRRFKPVELLGFAAIGLFLAFILYLAFAPQPGVVERPEASSTATTPIQPGSTAETITRKAAIVDQLGLRHPNPSFIDEARLILERAGFQVDVYPPEAVTVSLYKTVSSKGYRVIVFRVHMGVNDQAPDRPVGLFTTESYSPFDYQLEQLKDWTASAKAYGAEEVLFAVSPKFIKEATVIDYPSTIIILSGCFGLYSQPLPEAFLSRGASVILGWNGLVSVDYVDKATLRLLKALCLERLNVEGAVEAVTRDVGLDPEHGSRLSYYPANVREMALTHASKPLSLETCGEQTSTWKRSMDQTLSSYWKPLNNSGA